MKNDQNDFKIEKNIGDGEVDPSLKALVKDLLAKDNNVKEAKNSEYKELDPKLKALMNDLNIETTQLETIARQSERKLSNERPKIDTIKPEKLKF